MNTHPWLGLHLFYHDDLDRPIAGWVYPLVQRLQREQQIERFFFIRYWQGGPHLRLRLLPSEGADPEALAALASESGGAFSAAQPAAATMSLEDYLRSTEQLSRWEYGADQRLPFYPNNSVQRIAYQPEHQRYGGPAALAQVEQHFHESSALVAGLIAQGVSRKRRVGMVLGTMLLGLAEWDRDPAVLLRFFRFSAERWMELFGDEAPRYQAEFEQRYQQQTELRTSLAGLLERDLPAEEPHSPLGLWVGSVRALRRRLAQVAQTDGLAVALPPSLAEGPPATLADRQAMRIMLECLHMHNNRLQVVLAEEAYLTFLIQRILADLAETR